jgi:hypothetical protein
VLLMRLAVACGGGEAMHRVLAGAAAVTDESGQLPPQTPPPPQIATLLTACVLQTGMPTLRRAAQRALALLLALQLVLLQTDGGESG